MPGCRQSRRPPASAPERTPPACRTRYCASVDSNASAAARHVRATLLHAPPEVNVCATCHARGGTDMKSLGRCVGVLSVLLLAHVYAAAPARSSISAAGRAALARFNAADGTYDTRPAKRPVTIRHLMTHTSGLGYGFSSPIVARLAQNNREKEAELPLLHDPGDKWTYGTSTRILGLVVEKISGQSLDVFFRDRIFGPLKMTDTSYVVPPDKVSRVVTVHRRVDGRLVEQPNASEQQSPVNGEGGLYSTAQACIRVLREF